MAKEKRTYNEIYKEVQKIEDDITILTGKINESVRTLVQIEEEAKSHLTEWRQLCIAGKKGSNCLAEIEKINQMDIKEQENYDRLRKERNDKQNELRKDLMALLRLPKPPETKDGKKNENVLDLQRTSLISGTSKSSIDEVDFTRLFKHFYIDEETVPIQITPWIDSTTSSKKKGDKGTKKKKTTKPKGKYDENSKLSKKDPYYGTVYRGVAMGKNVCVKILSDLEAEQITKLQGHYESMRKMTSHPHLLPPIAASKLPTEPKVIVDLAEGPYPSLQDFVSARDKRYEKIGFLTKLRYAKQICGALAWLHGNKLLHLRLKPTNILFTKDWKIKVADYGLDLPPVANPPEGWIKSGHAYYYPPELLANPNNKSPEVDVYSFGLILYVLLTETFPYQEAKNVDDLQKLIKEKPVQLDEKVYPPSIISLFNSCINANPSARPKFEILASSDEWAKIYQDMVAAGNKKGQAIWDLAVKNQGGGVKDTIPWSEFAPILWKELGFEASPDPLQIECVQKMLYLENSNVTYKNWMRFLGWFSPFRTGKDGKEFVGKVVELLRAPWFYGREFDRVKSDAIINQVLSNKKVVEKSENKGKLPFLVRIAASQEDKYCLVICTGPPIKINHVPISPKDYVEVGISKYINDMAKSKKWFPTAEERPYDTEIFNKITALETKDLTESGENKTRTNVQANSVLGSTKYI